MKRKTREHYFKTNRKKEQLIEKLSKNLEKERRRNQCDCLHTGNNGYDVRLDKRGSQGEIFLKCRNCKKTIQANRVNDKTLADAIRIMNNVADTIKMHLVLTKPNDVKVANWISEFQYRVLYNIGPLYAVTQKNKDEYAKGDSAIYGKSTILRRH